MHSVSMKSDRTDGREAVFEFAVRLERVTWMLGAGGDVEGTGRKARWSVVL